MAVVVRPDRMPETHFFWAHPITSNVLYYSIVPLILSTARSDIDDSRALAPVVHLPFDIGHPTDHR